ncbi:hypothetical protein [Desulfurobacterium sp.]
MNKEKYSLYDFPELLYSSKLLTNRQRCIVLCLFSFLNLKGGGAFSIDILAEKTGIRKENLYRELKTLTYTKEINGVKKEFSIIRKEGKKISLDIERLKEFISVKLTSPRSVNTTPNSCQNDTKKVSKRHLESVNMTVKKCQNDTKKSPEAQESQKPDGCVNNILRKDSLDKKEIEEKEEKNIEAAEQKTENFEEKEKKENLGEENKEITPSLIALVTQNIVNEFKLCYKRKFNRYPLIDAASVKRVQEALAHSASNSEELKDIANHLIQKVPDFFKLLDKWVMQKGYSFYAFSYRIADLLSQPVSYQATNTPNVEFACSGGWK